LESTAFLKKILFFVNLKQSLSHNFSQKNYGRAKGTPVNFTAEGAKGTPVNFTW